MNTRIKQLMDSQHMNQQVFAEFLGISTATLSLILRGKAKVSVNTIEAIRSKFPTINLDWLMYGNGPMFNDNLGDTSISSTPSSTPKEAAIDFDDTPEPIRSMTSAAARTMNGGMTSHNASNIVVKTVDKKPHKISQILVFYDDQTWETFVPKK